MGKQEMTLKEIIDYAITKERLANRMYVLAAEEAKSPSSRQLFKEFADVEARHEHALKELDVSRVPQVSPEKIQDLRIAEFLEDVEIGPDADYQTILIYAMKREQKARDFYEAMADACGNEEARKLFKMLATQEQAHKKRIESIYDDEVLKEN